MAFNALLYLVIIPAVAALIAMVLDWLAYSDLRSRDTSGTLTAGGPARFPVLPAILLTPVILGLVLWLAGNPVADRIDQGLARTPDPTYALANDLYAWSALAFAIISALAVLSQALVARARIAGFVGDDFGRVLPLVITPETGIIFAMVLHFLVLGQVTAMMDTQLITTAAKVDAAVLAFRVFTVSAVALPVTALVGNRVKSLAGRGYMRALLPGEAGVFVVIIAFAVAFMQLAAL